MKNKKKKSTLLIMLLLLIVVIASTALVTYSLLSVKTEKKENVFIGSSGLKLILREPNWTKDDLKTDANGLDTVNDISPSGGWGINTASNYLPDSVINKNPYLINNCLEDEYVAMKVEYIIIKDNVEYKLKNGYTDFDNIATIDFSEDWVADSNSLKDVFYYNTAADKGISLDASILAKGVKSGDDFTSREVTTNLFTQVHVLSSLSDSSTFDFEVYKWNSSLNGGNGAWEESNNISITGLPRFRLDVTGYAIQADGIDHSEARGKLKQLIDYGTVN